MEHEVFISYSSKMRDVADKVVHAVESTGIKCWYAPRDVTGDYATSICDALEKVKVFVVLLDANSSNSPHVLNEVEIAYKRAFDDETGLILIPFRLDKQELSKAMQYYINRIHWIDASDSLEDAISMLLEKLNDILKPHKAKILDEKRMANVIYEHTTDKELKRLKLQSEFLHKFDGDIYEKTLKEYDVANILDVGTNDGSYMMDAIRNIKNVNSFLGVDINMDTIDKANKQFGTENVRFICVDAEKDNLEVILENYLKEKEITGFNVINISMVLLHLLNPEKLLKKLRKFLVKGGTILIKDVDDELELAYPDKNGYFEKAKELSISDPYGGYRLTGRQIPTFLHNSGYKEIELVKVGINTLDMDYDDKEGFFDMCFSYFEDDYELMLRENPNNKTAQAGKKWLEEHYQDLAEEFVLDDFFFSFGILLFKARR